MRELHPTQYPLIEPLPRESARIHYSLRAVIRKALPGRIWADDPDRPRILLARTPEGFYLIGDPAHQEAYPALKETIPEDAYLILHPAGWEKAIGRVWNNPAARPHPRQHWRFQGQPPVGPWKLLPEGFRLVPIDRDLLADSGRPNHGPVAEWVSGWGSENRFLERGFGFCVLAGETIASWCIADNVCGEQCEIGIHTDMRYRRRGLAAAAVAAALEHCLRCGLTDIGWHCLASNTGSQAVARKSGFAKTGDYLAYSHLLPAESAADMSPEEYRDWAAHYERFAPGSLRFAYHAAEAWAMAGEPGRALAQLKRLADGSWQGSATWLLYNWRFAALKAIPEFQEIVEAVRRPKRR
ncbi:MAG: GNAT family N-acetyltransferase [Armatimonadetes bacterium]|nr:GNAT family N-acetyltransferase [Armatimonadota bacterium]